MIRSVTRTIAGWGNYPAKDCPLFRPEWEGDVQSCLDRPQGQPCIARGLGRSYGDASLCESGVILTSRMNRLLQFDAESGLVECETGVSIADLLQVFLPRGFFPAVTPGTKFVTIGGAIASNIHGKNHHRIGAFSSCVQSFRLLTGDGTILDCSLDRNSDAYWATLGGMGLTGMILTAKVRLRRVESAYMVVDYQRTTDLDQTLQAFEASDEQYEYSVAWIDCLAKGRSLGRSVLIRGNHADRSRLPEAYQSDPLFLGRGRKHSVPFSFPSRTLNATTVGWFNALYYRRHGDALNQVVHFDPFFYPLDSIGNWNRIYGKRGFIQYQVVFPMSDSLDGLRSLLDAISSGGRASFLAVLKRFGPADESLLGFPREGCTLSLDIPYREGVLEFVRRLDEIVVHHGGRVYLAKDSCLDASHMEAMYPELSRFRRIRKQLDPQGRFASQLSHRVGLTG